MKGKGNDGTGNTTNRDDWETPPEIYIPLIQKYNFTFDCCATDETKKCDKYSSDFLSVKDLSNEVCWMNPPFSKAKEMFKHFFKIVKKGVAIYRCDNLETKIWQDIIFPNASWVFIPKGRVSYWYNPKMRQGKGVRFPSALIGLNVESPRMFEGVCIEVKSNE